jgi:hypothetical protein
MKFILKLVINIYNSQITWRYIQNIMYIAFCSQIIEFKKGVSFQFIAVKQLYNPLMFSPELMANIQFRKAYIAIT